MKKTVYILSLLVLLLGGWAAALWLLPSAVNKGGGRENRYGVNEGLELVELIEESGCKRYVVEDADGNELFVVPLRHCILDTRYRNGQLRFREQDSGREGFIDRKGMVTFVADKTPRVEEKIQEFKEPFPMPTPSKKEAKIEKSSRRIETIDLQTMAQNNPFYREASKILQGKLSETDAKRRHMILNYCEHLRTAYTTKDIDFLRQVFSDKALIIVGNVVKSTAGDDKCQAEPKVTFALHLKRDYIARLAKVFAANKKIDVKFSGFHIMRHPTMDGIYGVTLRQQYKSDRYSDDGYLFLLWDFRDRSMPLIHVRTWQSAKSVTDDNDVISIQDFNLE